MCFNTTRENVCQDDELELFLLRNHQNNSPVDIGTDEEFPMAQDKKLRCNADSNVSVFGEQANLILTKTNSFLMSKGVRPKESYPCGKVRLPSNYLIIG